MEKINKFKFKINKIYYSLFKERFNKVINFEFPKNINRWDLIKEVIKIKKFNSYLEIGCDDDHSFKNIAVDYKIGVDPYSGGNFRGTSDHFFSQNNRKFDCIFIDGLHEYDQVCNDLKNSLSCFKDWNYLFSFLPNDIKDFLEMKSAYASHFVASLELAKEGHVSLKQNSKINDLQMIKND